MSTPDFAVVGMAGRFPGARDLRALWRRLAAGDDLLEHGTDGRWALQGWDRGGFLDGVPDFDPEFFGMSAEEAVETDPQHRLLLELAYATFEDAGAFPSLRRNSRVGVYVGATNNSYSEVLLARLHQRGPGALRPSTLVGNMTNMMAARISHHFNLHGPSLTLDTACSSSIVGLSLAMDAISQGGCDAALVAGINLVNSPTILQSFEATGALSPSRQVRVFAEDADGTLPSEAAVAVLIKPLTDAVAAGDRIHGVIRGIGVNNDGASLGLMAPNPKGQLAAMRLAYERAGVDPATISYVEAHGTGTTIGDPIELKGIDQFFRATHGPGTLPVGSIKSELGHSLAAAGLSALVRLLLAFKHRTLLPIRNLTRVNPRIHFERTCLRPIVEPEPWEGAGLRRAGLNSFGFGGTNAHLIVEEPPAASSAGWRHGRRLITLAARTTTDLAEMRERLAHHLESDLSVDLAGVARATHRREALPHRWSFVAADPADAVDRLRSGQDASGEPAGRVAITGNRANPVFVFAGQGLLRAGMGRGLYAAEPTFRDALDDVASRLRPLLAGVDIRELLFAEEGSAPAARMSQSMFMQPAIVALELAQARLWAAHGVTPTAVIGHSLGELPAAHIAGVLDLDGVLRLAARRGDLMGRLPQTGGMLAVFADEDAVAAWSARHGLEIGVRNAPGHLVVSGAADALEALADELAERGVRRRRLPVANAFHSRLMEPMLAEFRSVVETVKRSEPTIPFVSNLTGQFETRRLAEADYWVEQVRQSALFADGVATLIGARHRTFLEVGPSRNLSTLVEVIAAHEGVSVTAASTLDSRAADDSAAWLRGAGTLWSAGASVDLETLDEPELAAHPADLPGYPFNRRRFWPDVAPGLITEGLDVAVSNADVQAPATDGAPRGAEPSRPVPRASLPVLVVEVLATLLEVDAATIDPDADLLELGLDSLGALRLVQRLSRELGVELYPTLLFEHRRLGSLIGYLEGLVPGQAAATTPPGIVPLGRLAAYALSAGQKRLWAVQNADPDDTSYNVAVSLTFDGPLDVRALTAALNTVARRHQAFRTRFVTTDAGPRAVVDPPLDYDLPLDSPPAGVDPDSYATDAIRRAAAVPFDLEAGRLFRCRLFRLGPDRYRLFLMQHHIVTDGWSLGVIAREISAAYSACIQGRSAERPEPALDFVDYAAWHNRTVIEPAAGSIHEEYWLSRFDGPLPWCELPADRHDPDAGADTLTVQLEPPVAEALGRLAQSQSTTPFAVLLATHLELLHRVTGENDMVVGVPSAYRVGSDQEAMVGFFASTLAVRSQVLRDDAHLDLIARVSSALDEARTHQDYPYDRLVDAVASRCEHGRRLFSTMVVMQNYPLRFGLAGVQATVDPPLATASKCDLLLNVGADGRRFSLTFEYDARRFSRGFVEILADTYVALLARITADPTATVGETRVRGKREAAVLDELLDRVADEPVDATLPQLFEAQAHRSGDALAVVGDEATLTYAELNRAANRVAHTLRAWGVHPDHRVGVLLDKGVPMVPTVLGVLKSGAAYVPLDPGYPRERLRYMVEASGVQFVVTQARHEPLLSELSAPGRPLQLLVLDAPETAELDNAPDTDPAPVNRPDDAAYVLFTSGSTGRPKGVVMPHAPLVNLLRWEIERYGLGPADRQLQFASLSFDVSFQEIFSTLLAGASLRVIPDEDRLPHHIVDLIARERISILSFPTAFFGQLAQFVAGDAGPQDLSSVRAVFVAGEALHGASVRDWQRRLGTRCTVVNAYGPTEAHVVTFLDIDEPMDAEVGIVPIGRPLPGVRVAVLDADGRPVGVGTAGELWLGGVCLARGYLDDPERTAERFVTDLGSLQGRFYRTGDLARVRADGIVEFLGRSDDQVKIRGYRVELGEVETALSSLPGVDEAAVVVRTDPTGSPRLVGFITASDAAPDAPAIDELRMTLSRRLPAFMVPTTIVQLDVMPMTPNGKLDRRHLPDVDFAHAELERPIVPPRTPSECEVMGVWREVLQRDGIGIDDDFFEVGGDSLLVMQVMSRLKAGHPRLAAKQLFTHTTVRSIGRAIEEADAAGEAPLARAPLPVPEPSSPIPPLSSPAEAPPRPSGTLVTGATGFLGGHLVAALLDQTDRPVHCLARAGNDQAARARVLANLDHLLGDRLDRAKLDARLVVHAGDLERDRFGWTDESYAALAHQVGSVYHAAANVSHFSSDDEALTRANVASTAEVIRFCGSARELNHVSTVGVFGLARDGQAHTYFEGEFPDDPQLPNAYEVSKHRAERRVREAMTAGLSGRVFRTGFVLGDSRTGRFKRAIQTDAMFRVLKAATLMGIVPSADDAFAEFLPVDFLARAIVTLGEDASVRGETLHLSHPDPLSWSELWRAMIDFGYPLSVVDPEWFAAHVYEHADTDDYLEGLGAVVVYLDDFLGARVRYDTTRAATHLRRHGIEFPDVRGGLVARYLRHGIDTGFLRAPSPQAVPHRPALQRSQP